MKSNENINIVLKYIEEHLQDVLTTAKLSQIAGYSEYHFIRMFKKYTNATVTEYIIKRRLIKASEDILSGEKIIDVALKYGWQSHSGFTKAFVKEFDFAPSLLKAMKISMEILGGNSATTEIACATFCSALPTLRSGRENFMSHVFLFETKVGQTKEELFELLQCKLVENGVDFNKHKLIKVYSLACDAYENVTRYSGEEYITHLLNVAIILALLGTEENVILAGMFCDVNKKGIRTLEELKSALDKDVYDIVQEVNNSNNALESLTDKVSLIKLAERLHNMRTIEFIDESKKREKAKETIELYMPLARKLNNQKLIDELNDLGMKYI